MPFEADPGDNNKFSNKLIPFAIHIFLPLFLRGIYIFLLSHTSYVGSTDRPKDDNLLPRKPRMHSEWYLLLEMISEEYDSQVALKDWTSTSASAAGSDGDDDGDGCISRKHTNKLIDNRNVPRSTDTDWLIVRFSLAWFPRRGSRGTFNTWPFNRVTRERMMPL